MSMLLAPSQISKSLNEADFEVHFGHKARRTGLLICYSISHKVIIQLTCALMQRLQYVETQIDKAMATIMQQDCARCCQQMQGFFAAVLRNEDMAPGL